ncbi:MAG: methylated-DNA--[protein]-cysteine S-methyltransferase [Phycisphaerae bacterium]|nr:methylated-DNA--[protein]-cysteine S-methyltransferase [Phycisphaerae bacterium]
MTTHLGPGEARLITDSPLGRLVVIASERGVRACGFVSPVLADDAPDGGAGDGPDPSRAAARAVAVRAAAELAEYFAGERRVFDVPLDLRGTPFQVAAWRALREIPFGVTVSYGEQARRLGLPNATRAVGAANGANCVGIIVPCHRVLDSRGGLHGYGGGLWRKQKLLELEGAAFRTVDAAATSNLFSA